MKVYLLAGQLPIYMDLIKYPPDGIIYSNYINHLGSDSLDNCASVYYNSRIYNLKRKVASILLNQLKIPVMMYIPRYDAELIHSTRGILILNKIPWVIDVDYVGYFFGNNIMNDNNIVNKRIVSKILAKSSCKTIICWSESAKKSILNSFKSNDISNKIKIIYPAIPLSKSRRIKKDDKLKILYVSSSFETKGGEETLKAFELLTKRYESIELIFKCDVSDEIKQKYNLNSIQFFPYRSQLLPRDDLINEFYVGADIFLYPTLNDLFGLSLLDAMSVGLPIVSTNTFAIPEIVEDGKNGFLIEPHYKWYDENYLPKKSISQSNYKRSLFINQIVEKMSLLIEDRNLRLKMGNEGKMLVEKGRFSVVERNDRLKAIYKSAVS